MVRVQNSWTKQSSTGIFAATLCRAFIKIMYEITHKHIHTHTQNKTKSHREEEVDTRVLKALSNTHSEVFPLEFCDLNKTLCWSAVDIVEMIR